MPPHNEERTEQATPQKRKEVRERGQVAKSMEVNAAVGLLAGVMAIKFFGGDFVKVWTEMAQMYLPHAHGGNGTLPFMEQALLHGLLGYARLIFPFVASILVLGVASNVVQTGFLFSTKTLAPDFARLSLTQGFERMFSMRALVDLGKSSVKAFIIGYITWDFIRNHGEDIVRLILSSQQSIGTIIADLCWGFSLRVAIVFVVIATLDYIYQFWQFERTIRMTKQEVKEEYKRTEGDPLVKSHIRARQRDMARRRQMADVRTATVVLTNPTHLAVALRYEIGTMAAPVVVAKGQRLVAEKIKAQAHQYNIPVIENKPLARALFAQCAIGQTIPQELYLAVAEIIAFVYRETGRDVSS
jgi:flagellar biosynthetic protein FlhB